MCEKKEAPGKGAMFACGEQSMKFPTPVFIRSSAAVVGKKEGEGPLGGLFDLVGEDDLFGCNTWEEAESSLQRDALHLALKKAGMPVILLNPWLTLPHSKGGVKHYSALTAFTASGKTDIPGGIAGELPGGGKIRFFTLKK